MIGDADPSGNPRKIEQEDTKTATTGVRESATVASTPTTTKARKGKK